MESLTKASWIFLALIHVMPALVLFAPSLTGRLYQTAPTGEIGLLIVHRGALFLAVVAACIFAILDPSVRRPLSCIVEISVIGFLFVYLRGGMPEGALRTIALVDLVALAPLAFVTFRAWTD